MTSTITLNNSDAIDCISNHDLAVLADWAGDQKNQTQNKDWKRAFGLLREGADLLLRRRARSTVQTENKTQEKTHENFKSPVIADGELSRHHGSNSVVTLAETSPHRPAGIIKS